MTLKCGICEKARDSRLMGAFKDVFYCADNPECVAMARTKRRIARMLGQPDPLAHLLPAKGANGRERTQRTQS